MPNAAAYAAMSPGAPLTPWVVERREPGPRDVVIDVAYSGICHSDIHQGREEWGTAIFPMVPGHEIAGRVAAAGRDVTLHAVGDPVGVGCYVDSCRECETCLAGEEQYCLKGSIATYNGRDWDGAPTYGGYSTSIVVDERYVLRIPASLPLDGAAPLLCAGITTYAPLKIWGAGPGRQVGVMGLGGLGHMAVKFAAAMGAEVTVLSHSPSKRDDAERLGAHHFIATSDESALKGARKSFDLIIDTISADHPVDRYLGLLRLDGTLCMVGLPSDSFQVSAGSLIGGRRSLSGSMLGGVALTQEMLDFCGQHGITSDIELIAATSINEAWERVVASDVRYRFVIDAATFAG